MKPSVLAATILALLIALAVPAPAYAGDGAASAGAQGWTWPVRGDILTPYRNGDDPYAAGQHRGIDIAAATGSPVVAAAGGTVTFAGTAGSSGRTVAVRTADGRFDTSYLHLSALAVREGEAVRAGTRIGSVGTSGRRSVQPPHLHFGVREAGHRHRYRDPMDFLPTPAPSGEPREPAPAPVRERGEPAPTPAPAEPVPAHARAPQPVPFPAGTPAADPAAGSADAAPHAGAASGRAPAAVFPLESAGRSAAGAARAEHAARASELAPPAAAKPGPRSVPAGLDLGSASAGTPDLGSAPAGPATAGSPDPASAAAPALLPGRSRAGRPASGALDAGWLAACLGLLALAAALSRSATRPPRATPAGTRAPGGASRRTSPELGGST